MSHTHSSFLGRSRELGQIRSALDGPEPSIVHVHGIRGVGKTALVARALDGFEHVAVRVPALPDPVQRRSLAEALPDDDPGPASVTSPPSWEDLLARAAARARPGRAPFALVLDDAQRLREARARFDQPLAKTLAEARAARRPFHVVLVGPRTDGSRSGDPPDGESVAVGPLPLRAAAPLLPGGSPSETLRAYGVLGGIPRVLQAVDRSLTLETNLRKLTLEPGAPFADIPGTWLERDLQAPTRYNAVLAHLAGGASDWSGLHEAVPDLTSSGQLAPYVRRLEELGLVEVRRSLDASPSSRARRYQVVDPFIALWYRFVYPATYGAALEGDAPETRIRAMRPLLDDHFESVFPRVCRQHMRHDALETLGANARELGSLWGPGYEIPVAGILRSGAAFYGTCHWQSPTRGDDPLGPLDAAARETRYGFGRERRLRLVFVSTAPPRWLERAAVRRDQSLLVGPEQLVGG